MPDKMVTDHWDMPSTPGMEFWIRGHAVSIFGFCYLMMCSPTASAAKAAFFISVGIGVLYPRAPGVSALPNKSRARRRADDQGAEGAEAAQGQGRAEDGEEGARDARGPRRDAGG